MPTQFSPHLSIQLIAALLLGGYVAAQYIGLRPISSLREALGLCLCTAFTLLSVALTDWLLTHYLLQPLGLVFLRTLVAVFIIAIAAQLIEAGLSHRYPKLFPAYGSLLPQIIIGTVILALPLITTTTIGLIMQLGDALLFGSGAALLIIVFQAIREHNANTEIPLPLRGAAIDMLSAGILIAACSGLSGIF